ncbi:CDK-activating kinase assembly factor MAT1 [Fasciolopsis buskii]|uniref:CDK-activating kinase assembly factor MAT1 n=1 Tax=Fasciolopsis buskii TaxID=27845 RepID=A0A8E0VGW5_9TREM|nr:CDK-activating kinase assembly factor MAT1 [Fasciolopsis buski]
MLDQSQSCPSCRANKYNNPQLKLMVNVCGHSLCENCVEVLFARGSGLCVQCKTPIRKANFRYQLFEDPLVQKEVELRKKILTDFNKREDDFDSLEEYDLYLEKIEEIVFNLMNDVDVDETKRYIEQYKKENKDIIKRNRLRPVGYFWLHGAMLLCC